MLNIFEDKRTLAGLVNTDNPIKHILDAEQINHTMYLLSTNGTTYELYPWSPSLNDFDRHNKFEIIVQNQHIDYIRHGSKRYDIERGLTLIKQSLNTSSKRVVA